jgi:hypothetical protein
MNDMQVLIRKLEQGFETHKEGFRSSTLEGVLSVGPGHDLS